MLDFFSSNLCIAYKILSNNTFYIYQTPKYVELPLD